VVCFGSDRAEHRRKPTDCRFLATRKPLRQRAHGDTAQLPSPTQGFASKGT
jgi:hypothetical protein